MKGKGTFVDADGGLVRIPAKDLRAIKSLAESAMDDETNGAAPVEMATAELDTLKAAVFFASERLNSAAVVCEMPGINQGEVAESLPKSVRSLTPFVARKWVAENDAAVLLNGGVPHTRQYSNDDDVVAWQRTLDQAVDCGEIQANPDWEGGAYEDRPLLHADIRTWCEAHGFAWPVPLPEGRKPKATDVDADLRAELDRARARIAELEHGRAELQKMTEAAVATAEANKINSPTLQRLFEAVAQYPAWRAAQNQEPNLKAVLGWQNSQQERKGNASRLAHVAHHIIAEHFGLKS